MGLEFRQHNHSISICPAPSVYTIQHYVIQDYVFILNVFGICVNERARNSVTTNDKISRFMNTLSE